MQIRDLDQTVVGNPVHDLIRLGLSLATAARGSALAGLTIVHMMEAMTAGYASAFGSRHAKLPERPEPVHLVMKQAMRRSWRQLAVERIEGRADDSAWPSLLAAECEGIPCDRHAVQRRGDRDTRDEPKGSQGRRQGRRARRGVLGEGLQFA